MTTASTSPVAAPRRSALDRAVAMRLAATEYERCLAALRRLSGPDWGRGTDCPGWDVHALAGHVLGMAEMAASLPEQARQMRAARRSGGVFIDALTALQVAKHASTAPDVLVARFATVGPWAARSRRRTPGLVRGRLMPVPQAVGGVEERWTVGYLVDVILTRDTWMHRVDLARATQQPLELSADHDGLLVAVVVAEWAQRHGQPCGLHLTGPAGGSWAFGSGGPELTEDAVEFCRGVSGRSAPLLATEVPF